MSPSSNSSASSSFISCISTSSYESISPPRSRSRSPLHLLPEISRPRPMGAGREQFVAGPRDSVRPVSHAALLVEAAQEGAEEQELSEQVGGGAEDEREGTQSTEEKEGQKHHRRALHYSLYTRDHVQMLARDESLVVNWMAALDLPTSRTPSRTPSFTNLPEIRTPSLSPSSSSSHLADVDGPPSTTTPTTTPSPSPRKPSRLRAWLASPSRSLPSPSSPRASSSADEWDLLIEAEGAEHWGRDRCGYPSSQRGLKGLVKPHPEVRATRRYKLASAALGSSRGRQAREQAEGSSGG